MPSCQTFEALTPEVVIDAVEAAMKTPMSGLASPLPSYINRVYELQARDRTRLIGKFYRPGRWTPQALRDEHRFVLACAAAEIPVVAPLELADGDTLGTAQGIHFAVYPKRWGRNLEVKEDEDWRRLGRLLARVHLVGETDKAPHRLHLHPARATRAEVDELLAEHVTERWRQPFREACERLLATIVPVFEDRPFSRIHGDCHHANLLDRPDEGLMIIDFDDMVNGPPIHDIWMLLPGRPEESRAELNLILDGYEEFREFDYFSLRLVEPLRAMRMLYFLAWCAKQLNDPVFRHNFPGWGDDAFWARQTRDLEEQLSHIHAAFEG